MSGLLIVNADDFGGNALASSRIAECFAMGRITSTSAMVWMKDSGRAAKLAAAERLPVGLHLNLTQELDAPAIPRSVRERHAEAVRRLAHGRRARMTFDARSRSLVKRCVADQLECFRELYCHEPTHLDGHNHVHLSPTVLTCLPVGLPIRTAVSPRAHGSIPDLMRVLRRAVIARRHPCCELFWPLDPIAQSPSTQALADLIELAGHHTGELMVHPDRELNWRFLMSEQWERALEGCRAGSYSDLLDLDDRQSRWSTACVGR